MKKILLTLMLSSLLGCANLGGGSQKQDTAMWMDFLPVQDDLFVIVVEGVPILVVDQRAEHNNYYVGQKMIEFLDSLTENDNDDAALLWEVKRDYPPITWNINRGTQTEWRLSKK